MHYVNATLAKRLLIRESNAALFVKNTALTAIEGGRYNRGLLSSGIRFADADIGLL